MSQNLKSLSADLAALTKVVQALASAMTGQPAAVAKPSPAKVSPKKTDPKVKSALATLAAAGVAVPKGPKFAAMTAAAPSPKGKFKASPEATKGFFDSRCERTQKQSLEILLAHLKSAGCKASEVKVQLDRDFIWVTFTPEFAAAKDARFLAAKAGLFPNGFKWSFNRKGYYWQPFTRKAKPAAAVAVAPVAAPIPEGDDLTPEVISAPAVAPIAPSAPMPTPAAAPAVSKPEPVLLPGFVDEDDEAAA